MFSFFFQKWVTCQLYGDMNVENYDSFCAIDHTNPISSFNLLGESDMRECFGWINLRPLFSNKISSKRTKIYHHFHIFQEVKADIIFLKQMTNTDNVKVFNLENYFILIRKIILVIKYYVIRLIKYGLLV